MDDFALRHDRPVKGIVAAILAAIKFLVLPVVIVTIIISLLSDVGGDVIPVDKLEAIQTSLMIFSIPVIASAFLVGFYPKGSYSRMTFGVIYVLLVCLWIWYAFQGGRLNADMEMIGAGVDFSPLLLLIVFATSLKAVYYISEAPSYREDFLRKINIESAAEPSAAPAPMMSEDEAEGQPQPSEEGLATERSPEAEQVTEEREKQEAD